jgi:SAM-dependent methyltransferase
MIPSGFDFLDFGCSDGANINYIKNIDSSLRGLGIDIDQRKIDKAQEKGFYAINFDILKLPTDKQVLFVTMSHFLEHLPSVKIAETMIRRAIDVSHEFVFIRQPWFDSDGTLLLNDLKFYWSDWRGHPNKMTSLDFYLILKCALEDSVISGFAIFGRAPVTSTADTCLIPLDTCTDQHHYDIAMHGQKPPTQTLSISAYKEIVVIVSITAKADYSPFLRPLGQLTLLKSAGCLLCKRGCHV